MAAPFAFLTPTIPNIIVLNFKDILVALSGARFGALFGASLYQSQIDSNARVLQ